MTISKTHSSSSADPPARRSRFVVLEGMPGAGKTTVLRELAADGHAVVGEYLAHDGHVLDLSDHPVTDDDAGHMTNLLRKHRQMERIHTSPVYCDRDWLSVLAYAASTSDHDLLSERAQWVADRLQDETLLLPDLYVIFDLGVDVSLTRRTDRLDAAHPWAAHHSLRRLRDFYCAPAAHVSAAHCGLGRLLSSVQTVHLPAASRRALLRQTLQAGAPA